MRLFTRLLFSFLLISYVATCGQQGPLYLPDEKPSALQDVGNQILHGEKVFNDARA